MPTYLQADRLLRVTTPLGPDVLLLRGFEGSEAISQLFLFQLELAAENDAKIPFDKLLGQPITVDLGLPKEATRYFSGICSRVGQAGRDITFTYYRMEVVPQLWLMTRKAQSRIFQRLSVPDILKQVLGGLDTSFELTGQYEPRDYCVQYRETDFNFASRLMEEEGIFYFFRHADGAHTMVLADSPQAHKPLDGMATVRFEGGEAGDRQADQITQWEKVQELRPGKYTLWDHSFEIPHKHLDASQTIQASVQAGTVGHSLKVGENDKLEVYDFPGEYAQRFDGIDKMGGDQSASLQKIFADNARTVGIRMQEEAASALTIRGGGHCRYLASGSRFTLDGHYDADGDYVIAAVEHHSRLAGDYRSSMGGETSYSNGFTCLPSALPFRPRRVTPKPVVHGTQTAVVVGPSGSEIFPDKYSRVKVQFHWDRVGKNDPDSSCWIRVGTPWAGKNWGMVHIPRVGQEVIVAFEEGDPDRPIIVGSVYNKDMMPPYTLPDNKTQSGLLSRSTLQGTTENFNELRFEDKKGSEEVYFHAEKDFNRVVENDDTLKVGFDKKDKGDQTVSIFNNQSLSVGAGKGSASDGSQTVTVFNNQTLTVGDPQAPDGSQTMTVFKDITETIKTGNRSVTIEMGNDSLAIKMGNQTTKLDLGASSTEAMQSITLKVGQSSIVIDQMGVTIKGMMVSVQGQIQTEVKGLMTQVSADAMLTVKGGITMIN